MNDSLLRLASMKLAELKFKVNADYGNLKADLGWIAEKDSFEWTYKKIVYYIYNVFLFSQSKIDENNFLHYTRNPDGSFIVNIIFPDVKYAVNSRRVRGISFHVEKPVSLSDQAYSNIVHNLEKDLRSGSKKTIQKKSELKFYVDKYVAVDNVDRKAFGLFYGNLKEFDEIEMTFKAFKDDFKDVVASLEKLTHTYLENHYNISILSIKDSYDITVRTKKTKDKIEGKLHTYMDVDITLAKKPNPKHSILPNIKINVLYTLRFSQDGPYEKIFTEKNLT